jgi:hypothetical protein
MPFCERLAAQRLTEVRAGDALAHAVLPDQ